MKTIQTLILGLVTVASFSFSTQAQTKKSKRKFFIMGNFRKRIITSFLCIWNLTHDV